MYRILTIFSFLIIFTMVLSAQTVSVLSSVKDNSMFSESGSKSLGAGKLFTGQTCQGNNRRALIEFDLSGIPTDAVVSSVTLNLGAENSGNNGDGVIEIFGVTKAWGEGFSSGSGNGGPAVAPDATWTDAMFGSTAWDTPGGDFDPAVLSARFTTENNQVITFPSSGNFVARAQAWIDNPSENHGIIIIGVENATCSAYRFGARDIGVSPELTVTWEAACEPSVTDLTIQSCESYTSPGGFTYTESGLFNEVIPGPNDCDSIFNIDLTILQSSEWLIEATLCEGNTFTLGGVVYDENNPSGTQLLEAVNGCDSTIIIDLSFVPQSESSIVETLCDNDAFSINVNGSIYDINNPSGTELLLGASFLGCDSTVNINLIFSSEITEELNYIGCEGDGFSVVVNGTLYDESQPSGTEIISDAGTNGCDSIININLAFDAVAEEFFTHSGCQGDGFTLELDGVIYDENNTTGSIFLVGMNGCDSIVNVDLVFATPPNAGMAATTGSVCNENDGLLDLNTLLNGADAGGIWTETSGNPSSGLSGNTFDGNGQNPGVYTFRYTVSNNNCPDDFTEVMVEVLAPITATVATTGNICNSTDNGNSTVFDFSSLIAGGSTNGSWTDTDGAGVDLTDINNVNFLNVPAGVFQFTYTTPANGSCPGETYGVDILVEDCTCPAIVTEENYTGCEGDNFEVTVNGVLYDQANPVGTETLVSSNTGCDSIVNINLVFNAPATSEATFETCDPNAPATTTEVIANGAVNGCDSVITFTTIYLEGDEIFIEATSCDPADEGTVVETFTNQVGCDSVVTTNTTLLASDETNIMETSCNPGDTGTVEVILINQFGCDSVVTTVTELEELDNSVNVMDATVVATIFGATYQWIDCDNNNAPIAGETARLFTATTSGNYAVEIMQDGCMVTSECVMVTVVNTEEVWFADQIDVLPNPTSGAVRLKFEGLEKVNVRIMEVTGKILLARNDLTGGTADLFLDGPAGLYFVGVEVDGIWGWMKVVKN